MIDAAVLKETMQMERDAGLHSATDAQIDAEIAKLDIADAISDVDDDFRKMTLRDLDPHDKVGKTTGAVVLAKFVEYDGSQTAWALVDNNKVIRVGLYVTDISEADPIIDEMKDVQVLGILQQPLLEALQAL